MVSLKSIKDKLRKRSWKQNLRILDDKFGLRPIETFFAGNWFNPFATLWINFRSFPLRQAVRFPFYAYGCPRIYGLSGNMLIDGPVKSGMIVFNHSMDRIGAPSLMSVQSEICNRGTIIFKGSCDIGGKSGRR